MRNIAIELYRKMDDAERISYLEEKKKGDSEDKTDFLFLTIGISFQPELIFSDDTEEIGILIYNLLFWITGILNWDLKKASYADIARDFNISSERFIDYLRETYGSLTRKKSGDSK